MVSAIISLVHTVPCSSCLLLSVIHFIEFQCRLRRLFQPEKAVTAPTVVSCTRSLNFEDDGTSPCDIQSGYRIYQVTLLSLGDFMFFISCVLIVSEYKNSLLTLETDGTSSTGVTFSSLLSFSPWESSVKC